MSSVDLFSSSNSCSRAATRFLAVLFLEDEASPLFFFGLTYSLKATAVSVAFFFFKPKS